MGDSESKINYTPEEMAEIDRIISEFDEVISGAPPSEEPPAEDFPEPAPESSAGEESVETEDTEDFEEPEEMDIDFPEEAEPEIREEPLEELDDESITILDEEEPEPPETAPEDEPAAPPEAADDLSTLDQLEELTRDEPESVESTEDLRDDFTGDGMPEPPAFEETPLEDDFPAPEDVSFGEEEGEAPELDNISLSESDIPEGDVSDIPDIDFDDMDSPTAEETSEETFSPDEDTPAEDSDDLISIDEIDDFSVSDEQPKTEKQPRRTREESDLDDVDKLDLESLENEFGDELADTDEEPLEIEPLDDSDEEESLPDRTKSPSAAEKRSEEDPLELSNKELKQLRKALFMYSAGLRSAVKNIIINDKLPVSDAGNLIEMIISGKSESAVKGFIQKRLDIEISDEAEKPKRKIISSRPEYTREGIERQKKLLKMTKIFGLSALAAFVLTVAGYQYVYKPVMAKKTIDQGTTLIIGSKHKDFYEREQDILEAENLFDYVEEHYVRDYLYGYNSYGRAYLDIEQYDRSLDKLNNAFRINPHNIDTLNNLGRFYSRLPEQNYPKYRPDVIDWYYKDPDQPEKTRMDLAIDFYSRVLLRDKNNITALLGIGDVYFHNGEFLKAKQYYENILKVDPKSIAGHSGLLNLYIERDIFDQVVQMHTDLQRKKMLEDLPSPLLAKTADYYLGKHDRDGDVSPTIRYGIDSPRFVDDQDTIRPAIRSILTALNNKNPQYPPLHYHFARLARMEKNREVMRRHLDRAIALSPDYFDAHHLQGVLYYETNQPVRAYRALQNALESQNNPPDFTREDFYKQSESPGQTRLLLGNVFYYFFDRLAFRRGSLEHESLEGETEQFANYEIAKRHYEASLEKGFSSPELNYNLGRIYYLERRYESALEQWFNLYEDFVEAPELMLSLGNALYHNGNYNSARGEYLKLIASLEHKAERIRRPEANNPRHYKLYMGLSSAYNNLAAVYQLERDETRTSVNYWKSIDYAKRLGRENEYARVNLARAFKGDRRQNPIIDENIPYSIDYYREDMRKR